MHMSSGKQNYSEKKSEYIKGLPLKIQMRQYWKSFPGRELQSRVFSRREWYKRALMFRHCGLWLRGSLCVISLWEQEAYQLGSTYPKYPRNRNMPTFPPLKLHVDFCKLRRDSCQQKPWHGHNPSVQPSPSLELYSRSTEEVLPSMCPCTAV